MPRAPAVFLIFALTAWLAASAQTHRVDDSTGVETWETRVEGVSLSLTQILPDQARAFYLNRGFPAEAVEDYANACVFMAVMRNDAAPGAVRFRLSDWSVVSESGSRPPVGPAEWLEALKPHGLGQPAVIAFRWAQFPSEQIYEPGGDWNQGMFTARLPAGARFDLIARWDVAGTRFEGVLPNVLCAP